MVHISVIVPAYNQAKTMAASVDELLAVLSNFKSYELIIVEDGSTDGTSEILKSLAKPNLVLSQARARQGKGAAIMRGMSIAKGDIVGFIDSDLAPDPASIPKLANLLGKYDVVIASRAQHKHVRRSMLRKFITFSYNLIANLLFKTNLKDHNCGLKLWTRNVNQKLLPILAEKGFVWDMEFLYAATKNNFKISEQPVTWTEKQGEFSLPQMIKLTLDVFKLRLKV